MAYTPIGWQDLPSEETPISADNLNHMDEQIKANTDALTDINNKIDFRFSVTSSTISGFAEGIIESAVGKFGNDFNTRIGSGAWEGVQWATAIITKHGGVAYGQLSLADGHLYPFYKIDGQSISVYNEFAKADLVSYAYNPSKTYAQGEFCINNNTLWKSKVANNAGNTPADGSYWISTNVGSELSEKYSIEHFAFNTDGAGLVAMGTVRNDRMPFLCIPRSSNVGFWYSAQIFIMNNGSDYVCACKFINIDGSVVANTFIEFDMVFIKL